MARFDLHGLWWQDSAAKLRSDKTPKVEQIKALPLPLACSLLPTPLQNNGVGNIIDGPLPQAIMDIEVYVNYFLVNFLRVADGVVVGFEVTACSSLDAEAVLQILSTYEVITFNGNHFDMPLLKIALSGQDNATLKLACDDIIIRDVPSYKVEQKYVLPQSPEVVVVSHIDLIELPAGNGSLKVYGGRLHCQKMQDLPIAPATVLTRDQMDLIREYCGNDLEVTLLLFKKLQPQIALRRTMSNQYRLDLRSKSDAQIAEAVIVSEITAAQGKKPVRRNVVPGTFNYVMPAMVEFTTEALKEASVVVTTKPFTIDKKGKVTMPSELSLLKVQIGSSIYQMGMGGLHSTEESVYHIADDEYLLCEFDVNSYYPSIILGCQLFPKQLGKVFLEVYQALVTDRLAAKALGNKVKADALKITTNGSFGKLGSPYSALYSPELLVQVTVTGQLCLLMLIEQLESAGVSVVSANTDGVLVKCPHALERIMIGVIQKWEERTSFVMERNDVAGHYGRDVNNYISVRYDGSVKKKGVFSFGGLAKNPQNEICNIAFIEYLKFGIPFEETIEECKDITKFVTIRKVEGGAIKDGVLLGKVVRWYASTGVKGSIKYASNGNDVPKTFGCRPLMELPDVFPSDIDYKWYVKECYKLL